MNERHLGKKKGDLLREFTLIFGLFGLLSMILSIVYTTINEREIYFENFEDNLNSITDHLNNRILMEGNEFKLLVDYVEEHQDEIRLPAGEPIDYEPQYKHFEELFLKKLSGKTLGMDIGIEDLDPEVKLAYAEYRLNYWRAVFEEAKESFGLKYAYFIYPSSEDHMIYFIDPAPEETEIDGEKYIVINLDIYEDPAKFPVMWEAWESGKNPGVFDEMNNEFGHVYTAYSPLWVGDEKIGMICADISVDAVDKAIATAVASQVAGSLLVLIIGLILIGVITKKVFINRIVQLESSVVKYGKEKDDSIAKTILEQENGKDEITSLSDHFAGMIVELKDYMTNLQKVTAEKERIGAELNVATQIQADMLPRIFPLFSNNTEFGLFATMDPAKEVGGDFYDFFLVDEDHIALVVADVSGKGVPAALFMVIAKTLIKNRTIMGGGPAEVLTEVNNQLCEGNEAELFVTVWLAIIDLNTGKGVAANAGHEHPAIRRKDGKFELIEYKHSPAVATMEGIRFREHEFELHPGDTVFEYTDGVTEATNAHNELFGNDRLINALNIDPDAEPEIILKNVRSEIDRFVADAPQFDDITMLGFRYNGKETEK